MDQLAAIKTVIQNTVGDGIFDHGSENALDDRRKLAPYKSFNDSYSTLLNKLGGEFQSHWSARPLRSLNSLALENTMMSGDLETATLNISKLLVDVALLKARLDQLEAQEDPFASVPINDASPLVPALSLTFKTEYGKGRQGFVTHAGPLGAVESSEFFVEANAYSQVSYVRGGFEVVLSDDCVESLGGRSAIVNGQVVIQATPLHFSNSSPWLYPEGQAFAVGRVDDQTQHEFEPQGYYDPSDPMDVLQKQLDQAEFNTAESLRKQNPQQVLNAFANFYQCTLNVFVDTRNQTQVSIHVYPVSSVPDIVEQGHDLRGYPHFGGWVGRVSDHPDAQGTWGEASVQGDFDATDAEPQADPDNTYSLLAGDVTNPDIYRTRGNFTDVSDGNYVKDGLAKDDIFGKNDDLRGFAQSITFLRPDRFSILTLITGQKVAAPEFGSEHNAPNTHLTSGTGVRLNNFDALPETLGANGRFMPSFSLVVYKNTFTGLGSNVNQFGVKKILTPQNGGMRLVYNRGNVPNEDGDIIDTGDTSTRGGS